MFYFIAFLLRAIGEIIIGIFMWPFNRLFGTPYHEVPNLFYIDTETNQRILSEMPVKLFPCPAWLTGPSTQTILSSIVPVEGPPFKRRLLRMPDGVEVAIDVKELPGTAVDAPLVVICPGLAGGSDDPSVTMYANAVVNKLGWRCIVYVRRGHQGTSLIADVEMDMISDDVEKTKPKLFPKHCDLDDMVFVANHIYLLYPNAPKFLAGLSVGSNLVVKYLAECEHKFIGGLSFCNGLHLPELTMQLDKNQRVISAMMTEKIKGVLRNNLQDIKTQCQKLGIEANWHRLMKARSIREFERETLPLNGYTVDELDKFYIDMSCFDSFDKVQVPLLCMTSMDDPIIAHGIPRYSIDAAMKNKNIITVVTKRGGHLGWIVAVNNSWSTNIFTSYFQAVLATHIKS